nr:helix-turn-helix domain-containing protein [Lacticaseibacillus kribbianus]
MADLNEADFADVGAAVSVDTYRFHLLSDTVAYAFFDRLFTVPGFDAHAFCQDSGVSLPTLRRRIAPFRAYMAQAGVTLNPTTWRLEGSELRIRLLILTFYQMAYRGVGWPFSTAAYRQAVADLDACNAADSRWFDASAQPTKLDLMVLAIQRLRLASGHPIAVNRRFQGIIGDAGMTLAPLIYTPATFPALDSPTLAAERDFYYFCRVHFLSFNATVTPIQERIMAAFAVGDHAINRFAGGLMTALIDATNPTMREAAPSCHAVLAVNLHRMALSSYVTDGAFAKRLDFMPDLGDRAENGALPRLIQRFFTGLTPGDPAGLFRPYYQAMHRDLYRIIAPDFPGLNADHLLTVAVFVEPGTFVSRDLLQFLTGLDFVRVLDPAATERPDLIISGLSDTTMLAAHYGEDALANIQLVPWAEWADDNDFFHLMTVLQLARRA